MKSSTAYGLVRLQFLQNCPRTAIHYTTKGLKTKKLNNTEKCTSQVL